MMEYQHTRKPLAVRMIPLVLAAFVVGFLFQLSTYDSIRGTTSQTFLQQRDAEEIHRKKVYYSEGNELEVKSGREKPLWLQPKLFDLNFTWIQNNEMICGKNEGDPEDLRLMPVLVHTARSHFDERMAIRKSWGSLPVYKRWDLRFVFLLGEAKHDADSDDSRENTEEIEEEDRRLAEEHAMFGDVVIGSFIDTYHNLTYKHMMGYKWALNFCRNATMVLKVDDDVFIDIIQWLDWLTKDLESLDEEQADTSPPPDIYCKIWARAKPFRKTNSKWFVSRKDWPKKFYPPFCSGWAYSIPISVMEQVYSVSNDIKFNWIDDVFVTGQLFQLLKDKYEYKPRVADIGREVTTNPGVYKEMCERKNGKRKFKVIAKVERGELFERDMMCMWNKTLVDNSIEINR